jgi:hypothetical protein
MHPLLEYAIIAFGFAGVILAGYYNVLRSPPNWFVTIAVLMLFADGALMIFSMIVDFTSGPPTRRLHPTILMPYCSAWALIVVLRRDYRFRKGARRKRAVVRARKARIGARALRQSAASARRVFGLWRDASKD